MGDKINQNRSFPSLDAWERVEYVYIFIIYLTVSKLLLDSVLSVSNSEGELSRAVIDVVFYK